MKSHKLFSRIVCILLCVVMLAVASLTVFSQEGATLKQYVKDVKLIYAESKEEAKNLVPKEYILLEYDLNDGTEGNGVYMAYSTTTNPDEAATDIKMMNMEGGYVLSDYEDQIKDVKQSVKDLANDVKIAAEMFVANYEKSTYGAKAAYRALSAFTVDEADDKTLANYIIYDKPDEEFYIKLVLNAHQDVLSAILSALAMAVQGEPGNTWLDRLTEIADPDPNVIGEGPTYWDDSNDLWEHFYGFYQVYITIDHSLYDPEPAPKEEPKDSDGDGEDDPIPQKEHENPPEIENNGTEALYEVTYRTLDALTFGNGTKLSSWFLGPEVFVKGLELNERYFALLEVLTPEELAMMRLCGPLYMILATGMDENSYNEYISRVESVMEEGSTCSIWVGVNSELFRSSIGITDDAARKIAESKYESQLNNDGDSLGATGLRTAGLIAACGAVSLGVGLITYYGFGALMLTCFSGTGLTATASFVSIAGTIFGATALTAGIVAVVVAIIVALVFLVIWIIEICKDDHPVYTEIPEFMYDYVEDGAGNNQFVLYESVRFQDGQVADVNTWEGKQWHAMYVSHDKAAGAPIEADFIVRNADGRIDEGYAGLSEFGRADAVNLNKYDFDDEVKGIFVTYRQEKLQGDFAKRKYLSNVKLFRDESEEKCKLELKNQKYTLYDYNLTPNSDYYTYLGYKTTNNETQALKDIRLMGNYSDTQYSAGANGETYAMSGNIGKNLTLYSTRISLFGTPILSDFLITDKRESAPAGYEPVNFFLGGAAVNMNNDTEGNTKVYFYFLPSTTYTSGEQYLGGLALICGGLNVDNGYKNAVDELGFTESYMVISGSHSRSAGIVYSTTYNPYRAIYGITAYANQDGKGDLLPEFISYDGVMYFKATRIMGRSAGPYFSTKSETAYLEDAMIYIQGIGKGKKPLKVDDIYASGEIEVPKDGFIPVSSIYSTDGRAANLADGLSGTIRRGKVTGTIRMGAMYLYVRGEERKIGDYVTGIYVASKENVLTGVEDVECGDVDDSYVVSNIASKGAHYLFTENLNLEDGDNTTFLGYTKLHQDYSNEKVRAITNIVLYYAADNDKEPEPNIYIDKISYDLVSDINLFCPEDGTDSSCKRVYIYYTTNPAAGSGIIDIKLDKTPIIDGWETARTQNKKALQNDMDEHSGSMWYLHMKRITEDPKYISEIVIGIGGNEASAKSKLVDAGCEYILDKDLNDGVGAHSHYIYIGYKRTSDPNKAIRDLRTTHDKEVDSFEKNGVTYYKLEGNLNSWTHWFADNIFLYYTMDPKAGTPIISLSTSSTAQNWSYGDGGKYEIKTVVNQKDRPSDFNDNCGYQSDYIYLLMTRDKTDTNVLASMIGNGSLVAIIIFVLLSAGVVVCIIVTQKKKRQTVQVTVEEQPKSDDKAEGEAQE